MGRKRIWVRKALLALIVSEKLILPIVSPFTVNLDWVLR